MDAFPSPSYSGLLTFCVCISAPTSEENKGFLHSAHRISIGNNLSLTKVELYSCPFLDLINLNLLLMIFNHIFIFRVNNYNH